MAEPSLEEAAAFLPKWLSPKEQKGLFDEIKRFPEKLNFFDLTTTHQQSLLQGDGWRGLVAINFQSVEKKTVSGVVISNSCDIDINNAHDTSPNVLFIPLVKLTKFVDVLKQAGKNDEEIAAKVVQIKQQRITSLFYFPKCADVMDDSILILDDVHRHPLSDFVQANKTKLFTLTQAAFWLFLMKLSIHFHRINENVHRHIESEEVA